MKRVFFAIFAVLATVMCADAYQVLSSKEFGQNDARNQNIVVKCTTDTGKVSNETCSLRRYAKCTGGDKNKQCAGWLAWRDLRTPNKEFSDWRTAASTCCRDKGLR